MNQYGYGLIAAVLIGLYLGGQYGFSAVFWIFTAIVVAVAALAAGVITGIRALLRWMGYL